MEKRIRAPALEKEDKGGGKSVISSLRGLSLFIGDNLQNSGGSTMSCGDKTPIFRGLCVNYAQRAREWMLVVVRIDTHDPFLDWTERRWSHDPHLHAMLIVMPRDCLIGWAHG